MDRPVPPEPAASAAVEPGIAEDPGLEASGKIRIGGLEIEAGIARILDRFEESREAEAEDAAAAPTGVPPEEKRFIGPGIELPIIPPAPRRRRARWVVAGVTGVSLIWGGLAWQAWSRPDRSAFPRVAARGAPPPATAPRRRALPRLPVEISVDAAGRATAVRGADPARVLAGYCRYRENAARLRPLGLSPAPPAGGGMTLGHFEDLTDISRRRAIRIHLDPRSGRWQAGDGRTPIPVFEPGLDAEPRAFGPHGLPDVELVVQP